MNWSHKNIETARAAATEVAEGWDATVGYPSGPIGSNRDLLRFELRDRSGPGKGCVMGYVDVTFDRPITGEAAITNVRDYPKL